MYPIKLLTDIANVYLEIVHTTQRPPDILYCCVIKCKDLLHLIEFIPLLVFSTTFLTNCGRSESLETTTCPKTVVGGKQGYAPCKVFLLQQSFFLCQLNFRDLKTVTKLR